ncbi:hypothetical protein [Streptomyces sp. 7N604]|uniref:hypothetical protein n=1 Tax=Streptomyces sp. 7N604 TaxID=3457415 RepID=UPI003FD65E35
MATWLGRGDEERERTELERLDRSAGALADAGDGELDSLRIRQQAIWQTYFETAFENLREDERERAAEALRALLGEHMPGVVVSVGDGGQTVGGNVVIRADHGSAAAMRMGDVTLGNPSQPGPHQG